MNGFYWSALMAFYHFVKYIKLEDLVQADHALSFLPVRSENHQKKLLTSHFLITEYGSLKGFKKK
jgi:hypothetical protein